MYRTDFGTLWEKARVGCSERTALKQVYHQGWNRSPVQVGCMRQVLRAGTLGWPRGMGWGGWWEGGSGRGTHVNPWLIHVNVWQKPLQYCKVFSLQLIKKKKKKKKEKKKNLVHWPNISFIKTGNISALSLCPSLGSSPSALLAYWRCFVLVVCCMFSWASVSSLLKLREVSWSLNKLIHKSP